MSSPGQGVSRELTQLQIFVYCFCEFSCPPASLLPWLFKTNLTHLLHGSKDLHSPARAYFANLANTTPGEKGARPTDKKHILKIGHLNDCAQYDISQTPEKTESMKLYMKDTSLEIVPSMMNFFLPTSEWVRLISIWFAEIIRHHMTFSPTLM